MPRPGFLVHPKYIRLCHLLGNRALALGSCELLWETAYQSGNPLIGTELDVELIADWKGDRGKLCKALLDCRLIDKTDVPSDPGRNGTHGTDHASRASLYTIHDLMDHAPEYVLTRSSRERERQKVRDCEQCGTQFRSPASHARFCNSICRKAHARDAGRDGTHDGTHRDASGTHRDAHGTHGTRRDGTPTPAPAPAPESIKRTPKSKKMTPPTIEQVLEYVATREKKIDPQRFLDHYTANGWVQSSGRPIKDWKATVRTWEGNRFNTSGHSVDDDEKHAATMRKKTADLLREQADRAKLNTTSEDDDDPAF